MKHCLVWCLLLTAPFAFSQKKPTPRKPAGEIENTEIVIEKNRKIELPPADRNFEKITGTVQKPEITPQQYDFQDFTLKLPGITPRLQILPPPVEKPQASYGNYAKGGFGNYATSYAELFLNNKQDPNFNYGFHGKHLASATGPVRNSESASAEQQAELFGKYKKDKMQADLSAGYQRRAVRFYGYTPTPNTEDILKDRKHIFNTFVLTARLKNRALDSLLGYNFGLGITQISDNFAAKEFAFNGELGSDYVINENLTAAVSSDIVLSTRQDSKGSLSRNLVRVKPEVRFRKDNLMVTAGLNVITQNDTGAVLKNFNLYPVLRLDYNISKQVKLFAGVSGDVERNSLLKFSSENYWLAPNFVLQNTEKPLEISAGVQAQAGSGWGFALKLNYEKYKNLYFFTNTKADSSQFEVVYETGMATVLHPQAAVSYSHDKWQAGIKTDFYNYQLPGFAEPFHRPKFMTSLFAKYNFAKNLLFSTEFYYIGGLNARNNTDFKPISLKSIADLNLKGEYKVLEKLSVFASVNNLFSQHYQRYLNYQARGIQVLAGASYLF